MKYYYIINDIKLTKIEKYMYKKYRGSQNMVPLQCDVYLFNNDDMIDKIDRDDI